MKKLIAFLLLLIIAATLLCGCAKETAISSEGHGKRFERIYIHTADLFRVYVDTETGVEYVFSDGTFRPLIDSYGNPYIYPAYDAREDKLP